jgi:hypothetical protein
LLNGSGDIVGGEGEAQKYIKGDRKERNRGSKKGRVNVYC